MPSGLHVEAAGLYKLQMREKGDNRVLVAVDYGVP
uniref:Uncharacterized protein n=1 Tax=Siphoviridae sp. ctTrD1 TaxID=2825524 RepID=A0A8S5PPB3_9CAUD|nr:MAG TPA: hypothetical protein [Siphoviridae sp. ctTrD1]